MDIKKRRGKFKEQNRRSIIHQERTLQISKSPKTELKGEHTNPKMNTAKDASPCNANPTPKSFTYRILTYESQTKYPQANAATSAPKALYPWTVSANNFGSPNARKASQQMAMDWIILTT